LNITEKIISKKIVKEKIVSFKLTKQNRGAFVMSSYGDAVAEFCTKDNDGSKITNFLRNIPEFSILTISYKETVTEESK